jgi:hypothetical protein
MRITILDHHQFVVVGQLLAGEQPGPRLQRRLAEAGIPIRGYWSFRRKLQMLELAGLVVSRREEATTEGHCASTGAPRAVATRWRVYTLTDAGRLAWLRTRDFFRIHGEAS